MITFANGASYETIRVLGSSENCRGQKRRTLAISIAASLITIPLEIKLSELKTSEDETTTEYGCNAH